MSGPSILMRLNAAYNRHYDAHPIKTLVVANGTLSTCADVVAQNLQAVLAVRHGERRPEYDFARTGRFLVFGLAMGPLIGKWLRLLETTFPMQSGGTMAVIKRVAADQAVMAPFGLTCFVGSMGIMEGKSTAELKKKFSDVWFTALKANWKVWPAIQAVNFGLIPIQYRLPFQQTCGIAWSAYLSLLNSRQEKVIKEIEHDIKDEVKEIEHDIKHEVKELEHDIIDKLK